MIKIYNMDCLIGMQHIPSNSIDLVLTDPPYGQNLGYGRGQLGERYIINDENLKWLAKFVKNIYRVLKNDSHCFVFNQWRTFNEYSFKFIQEGFKIRPVCIWDKKNS